MRLGDRARIRAPARPEPGRRVEPRPVQPASAAGPASATRRSTAFTSPANGAACARGPARPRSPTAACGGVSSSSSPAAPSRSTCFTPSGGARVRNGSSTASSEPSRRSTAAASRCAAARSRGSAGAARVQRLLQRTAAVEHGGQQVEGDLPRGVVHRGGGLGNHAGFHAAASWPRMTAPQPVGMAGQGCKSVDITPHAVQHLHARSGISMSNLLAETVTDVRHWTDSLFSFRTTRDPAFRFLSGQFTMIGLEVDGKPLMRAYSMAPPITRNSSSSSASRPPRPADLPPAAPQARRHAPRRPQARRHPRAGQPHPRPQPVSSRHRHRPRPLRQHRPGPRRV